jgi:hypothetical protein
MVSDTLDDKLREILDNHERLVFESTDMAIAQIKQAFADAGYPVSTHLEEEPKKVRLTFSNGNRVEYMTGQEWYNRFEKALEDELYGVEFYPDQARQAARKAANL